jgi:histidine triad (HIT) family protein
MTKKDCLFCKIIAGDIPSTLVYEDEHVFAIRDLHPVAPTHVLILPKNHAENLSDLDKLSDAELCALMRAVDTVAKKEGLTEGYRLISNCGKHGCQTINHLHLHLIGGKQLPEKLSD